MAKHIYGPGGGQLPIRSDEKMGKEDQALSGLCFSDGEEQNSEGWKKLLKTRMKKLRRRHDKESTMEDYE